MAEEGLLAALAVEITQKGFKETDSAIDGLGKKCSSIGDSFSKIGALGLKMFAGISAGVALFAKAAADDEAATAKLKSALTANGQEVVNNTSRLSALAQELQEVTNQSKDTIKEQMAYALNLGVTADQMQNVIEAGIGLGTSVFGGDTEAGIKAVTMAMNGNTRELDRLIPGLKNLITTQDKLNLITKFAARGFQETEDATGTFSGTIQNLHNHIDDAAESLGNAFLPELRGAVQIVTNLADKIDNLTDSQKENIVHWAKIAAVVSIGAIALGVMASIVETVGTVLGGIGAIIQVGTTAFSLLGSAVIFVGETIVALGGALIAIVTSPITLTIAAIGAIITAFAAMMGSGDTLSERVSSGFGKMYGAVSGWVGYLINKLKELWDYMKDLAKYWEAVSNDISGRIAKVEIGIEHPKLLAESLLPGKTGQSARDQLNAMYANVDAQTANQDRDITNRAQSGQHVDSLGDTLKQGLNIEANGADKLLGLNPGAIQQAAKTSFADPIMKALGNLEKDAPVALGGFQNAVKGLFDKTKGFVTGGGIGDLLTKGLGSVGDTLNGAFDSAFDAIAKKLGLDTTSKKPAVPPPGGLTPNRASLSQMPQFTSLEDQFKNQMAMQLLGGNKMFADPKTQIAKDQLTEAQKANALHKHNNDTTDKLLKKVQQLNLGLC